MPAAVAIIGPPPVTVFPDPAPHNVSNKILAIEIFLTLLPLILLILGFSICWYKEYHPCFGVGDAIRDRWNRRRERRAEAERRAAVERENGVFELHRVTPASAPAPALVTVQPRTEPQRLLREDRTSTSFSQQSRYYMPYTSNFNEHFEEQIERIAERRRFRELMRKRDLEMGFGVELEHARETQNHSASAGGREQPPCYDSLPFYSSQA
ncbi:uncharacterized protein DSM5745_09961 [Aspergillus mulundensis]|uniref:Uncharacterized protein n=1 Tax=Aspergillus mulundensis TaxID=1810919 RepID=A0A3D8QSC9_9EURO|nr:hypothetical protein DSM5745_09961 [Aspergillus mulundensis]RDW64550.1 hypothetical protein DSM5745_09961 [Aspergillus mulundensis]